MIPVHLGQSAARIGLAQALAQPQQQRRMVGEVDKSPQYGASARNYGLAEALQPISIDGGGWAEALAEAIAGGLRGRAARSERQGEVDQEQWDRNQAEKTQGMRNSAISQALQGFDPANPQAVVGALSQGAPEEALGLAAALAGREQPETFTDPYELNGAQVQRSNRSNRVQPIMPAAPSFTMLAPQQVEQMGLEPGSYQQNTATGQVAPINTQQSARGTPLERAQASADVDRVTAFREGADRDAATAQALRRFTALNQQEQGTGPGSIGSWEVGGFAPFRNQQSQQMAAITADLTPEQREPNSGATSDFDARMFMQALPGLDKSPEANAAMATAYEARAIMTSERVAVAEAWLEDARSLNGFDATWRRYVNANPIFLPTATPDNPQLNPNRMSFVDWARRNNIQIGTSANETLAPGATEAPVEPNMANERILQYNPQTGRVE